jgi:hypothetical protein
LFPDISAAFALQTDATCEPGNNKVAKVINLIAARSCKKLWRPETSIPATFPGREELAGTGRMTVLRVALRNLRTAWLEPAYD